MREKNTTEKIIKEHLILCEGMDAKWFFIWMLGSPDFSTDERISNEIQVMDFGGINELTKYLNLLKLVEGYSEVKSILIVRDAENSPESAIQSIKSSLKKNGFSVPEETGKWADGYPQIAYMLFPSLNSSNESGALEDLCSQLIKEEHKDSILAEIDGFLESMEMKYGFSHPRYFKNVLHTYFSAKDEFVSLKIGEAANANAFDWKSEKLDALRWVLEESFVDRSGK